MLRGVVFDMDYTLYDRIETDRRAIAHFYDVKRDMFAPDCTKEYAVAQMEIVSPVNSRKGWGYTTDFLFRAGVLAKKMDSNALCADFQRFYHEGIVPYDFCRDMLNALKNMGLKIGLITNGDETYQSGKVRALGFYDIFPYVLIGSNPATAKPHTDLFIQMAKLLRISPSELAYVGDHPINDVFASKSAGYTPIWVRACPWDTEGEPPKHTIDSVEGLPTYIKEHFDISIYGGITMSLAQRPPMGWNSWNTFASNIDDGLIREMADFIVEKGYLEAGYEYLVIDDCWSLRERGADGKIVPDPKKFPYGMKALADYVHGKGLKFGMYSCAGVRTCAGYPSSYDYEFIDAQTFAEWGVDFLKYDFCNFPESGNCKQRYLTMSMALKATGRDILFSACNWGSQEPWKWMGAVGAHMYRSTGDIMDNFVSFTDIVKSQIDHFCMSGAYCFNDMDMLTVGMCGKGNVGVGKVCTYEEYRVQFSLWCLFGAPLMMGTDLRKLAPEYENLLKNEALLAIDQDIECRAPYVVRRTGVTVPNPNPPSGELPWKDIPDTALVLLRHLSDNRFVLALYNLAPEKAEVSCAFADLGLPKDSHIGLEMTDVFTGENLGVRRDTYHAVIEAHDCRMFLCRLAKLNG